MHFHGMRALTAVFPHFELQTDDALFDIHNAGVLQRASFDFQASRFEIEWRVENLLRSERLGAYHVADVVLRVMGVSACSGSGDILAAAGEAAGIDFIEYLPDVSGAGTLRFVFDLDGEILVSGTDCELRHRVVEALR